MPDSRQEQAQRLFQEGQRYHEMGQVAQAVLSWREVLRLDPDHGPARHALRQVGASVPQEDPDPARTQDAGLLIEEAQRCLRDGDPEAALSLLEAASEKEPEHLHLHGFIEMARSRLLEGYRASLGDPRGVPRTQLEASQVLKYNLPPEAGFLLSLVDGVISIEQLVSLSGFDEFRALRVLHRLVEVGILEIER